VSVVWALGEYAMRTAEPPETTALYVWALTVGGGATVERADVDRWVEANPDHPIAALLRAP
jgi:hypothetical protein